MGYSFKWFKEFPRALWDTFVSNAKENLPEFKQEVIGGAKAVLGVPAKIVNEIVKPLQKPLILIAVIAVIGLIYWKKIQKAMGA